MGSEEVVRSTGLSLAPQEYKRIYWIDCVRGSAAVMVMFLHFWNITAEKGFVNGSFSKAVNFFVFDLLDLGKVGVVLFFCVSGFVIPFSLEKYKDRNIRRFCISRFFRLYPLYWVSIALTLVVTGTSLPAVQVLANVTMLQKFFFVDDLLNVYWTLQIEWIFYFLCGLLFYLGHLHKDRTIYVFVYVFIASAILLAGLRYMTGIKLPVAMPLSLLVMFLSFLWRRYLFGESGSGGRSLITALIIFLIAIPIIAVLAYSRDYGHKETWYRYVFSYLMALSLFIVISKRKTFDFSFLRFLGTISYSMYLLHAVVGAWLLRKLLEVDFGRFVGAYGAIGLSITVVIACSTITYFFIEKPSVDAGKLLIRRVL